MRDLKSEATWDFFREAGTVPEMNLYCGMFGTAYICVNFD
jgi:hypothetical protein